MEELLRQLQQQVQQQMLKSAYLRLIRLDKPIGTLLLLWPTLWGLWLAARPDAGSVPPIEILVVFVLGTFIMRSAGCVINDMADRNFDGHVERTRNRPLATGELTVKQASIFLLILLITAFVLVLQLNGLTILLSFIGAGLALSYPFMKRYTYWPQLILGFAFTFGIPMAFTAIQNHLPIDGLLFYLNAVLWPLIYDSFYAITDREDDLIVGIKSTAILFGTHDRLILALLQIAFFTGLVGFGLHWSLSPPYYLGLFAAAGFSLYQQYLIKDREPQKCFQAFLNNHYVGMMIFLGIVMM